MLTLRPTRRPSSGRSVLRVGYVPLLDAAPLVLAQQMGIFERHGLSVDLRPELGWASIREKLLYGELDAAHAPALMAFSIHLGLQSRACPVRADVILSCQGNAVTLSKRLWQKGVRDAATLRQVIRAESPRRMVFAVVSLFSSHHYLLRRWLEDAGIRPDEDLRLVVLPPNLVAEHMREGYIDGFCSGEPWNSAAVLDGEGWIAASSADIEPRHPEKALLIREASALENPEAYAALRQAVAEACRWCDAPSHRPVVADALEDAGVFDLPLRTIANALTGTMDLGAGRTAPAQGFIRFNDGDPRMADEWTCRQLVDQARHLGMVTLPPQLNITLARKLILPASARSGAGRNANRQEIPA